MVDWPAFALITYAFLLALLLAGIILRSLRDTKSRYQQSLEEKEQKLAALQLDLEETLEAMEGQAALLETEWSDAKRISQDSLLAMQHRFLELQGTLASMQSRLFRLEREPRLMSQAVPPFLATQTEMDWGEAAGSEPFAGGWAEGAPGGCAPEEAGPLRAGGRQALALLQSGMSVAEVSRALGCSFTEATLLYSQWRRGYLYEGAEEGPED